MSTKIESPPPRNMAQEGRDTLTTQIQLAPQQFAAEAQFAPQYAQLYQNILNQSLFGSNGSPGLLETYSGAAPQLGNLQSQLNTQQRLADIGDVEKYGGRAVQAFNQANPELAAIRNQLTNQGAGQAEMIGGLGSMNASLLGEAPQAQSSAISPFVLENAPRTGAAQVNPYLLGSSPQSSFAASPYDQVTSGVNSPTGAYSQRALSDLALGGRLGAQETRDLTNEVLSRYNRAGRANDPAAIAGTALSLDQAQQARLAQRQAAAATASGLVAQDNSQSLQAQLANQGAGFQQQGLGLQNALANLGVQSQYGLANQSAAMNAALANQSARQQSGLANLGVQSQYGLSNQGAAMNAALANQANQQQVGLANLGVQSQYGLANQSAQQQANLANQDYAYRTALANQQAQLANAQLEQQRLMQAAQFLQGSQIDPFQAILGRSGSLNTAMGATQQGAGGASYGGTGMFNPFNAYSQDLYNTNYNGQAAANIATGNNRAGILGAGIGGIGNIFGGWLGGGG